MGVDGMCTRQETAVAGLVGVDRMGGLVGVGGVEDWQETVVAGLVGVDRAGTQS